MKSSLRDSWSSLVGVIKALYIINPIFIIFTGGFFLWLFNLFTSSPEITVLLLSFLIFALTLIQYTISKKYAESSLSFMLGMLTVFTIEWTDYRAWIFVSFYVFLNVFMLLITSIRVSSEVEVYLVDAAYLLDKINTKEKASSLNQMIKESKTNGRISVGEKAIATYQLIYFNVNERDLPQAFIDLEIIKVLYRLDFENALDLYKSLHLITTICVLENNIYRVRDILDIIQLKRLTFLPFEIKEIIMSTRNSVRSQGVIEYFNRIKESNDEFLTKDEAIEFINKRNY